MISKYNLYTSPLFECIKTNQHAISASAKNIHKHSKTSSVKSSNQNYICELIQVKLEPTQSNPAINYILNY